MYGYINVLVFFIVKRLEIERSTEREPLDFKPLLSEKGTEATIVV